ncbi:MULTISPECIES: hypothetical protein [Mycobacterium]|uniref:Uncharacterized protein n=1 Tax=Mycobacterium kiyosense TaxID=2871094 RepID=A0A9P3QCL7_9MYCO|nr:MULTISPECIES: hypothetical protein [Mycobacterium]BDE11211.1 hypothetical protein MKCMC460_00710 [Mycobacterium sp. 20KCMC460]GLB85762.1 hypothetical protein SRL2020028_50180 [Mycobacterium kiyosense]GLB92420.1 hypothetical protein SRL2020130_52370 [Mycobacterium kiyosense]GLB98510.1 hypothetical protein SRL2020226_52860 [Mycobacterium kiyosense]GLC04709.1 hypothetical protein SRL2020400_53000 [Mycobacterium kiyosense]
MSDGSAEDGIPARVVHKASTTLIAAARRWAWTNPAVPIGLASLALAGYLVHRVGGHRRLGNALDSTVVTAGDVLDPDPTDTASLRHPVRRAGHAIIDRLTRGAAARRSAPR